MTKSMRLPPPGPDELAHAARLEAVLRDEIARDGALDFARFMQLADAHGLPHGPTRAAWTAAVGLAAYAIAKKR